MMTPFHCLSALRGIPGARSGDLLGTRRATWESGRLARFGAAGTAALPESPGTASDPALRSDEREQILVEPVLESGGQAMRRPRIDLQDRSLHELGGKHRRGADRDDLVVVAVDDQRRYVDL